MASYTTNEEIKDLFLSDAKDSNTNNESSNAMPKSSSSQAENDKDISFKPQSKQDENHKDNCEESNEAFFMLEITNATATKGTLKICPTTIPEEMAFLYSKEHNLDYKTMKEIEDTIRNLLSQLINEQRLASSKEITFSAPKAKEPVVKQVPFKPKTRSRPLSTHIPHQKHKKKVNEPPQVKKKVIIEKRYIDNTTVNLGIYLYHQGQKQQEKVKNKLDVIRKQIESDTNAELTFKPEKFTSNSSYNTLPNPKSDHLSKINKIKEERSSRMPFKPHINNTSHIKESFQERLMIYNSKANQNKKKLETALNCNYDHNAGQEYFKPKLIAKSIVKRANDNVFELNYDFASYYQRDKDYLLSLQSKEESQPIKCSQDTDVIFQKKKTKAFKRLFAILDNDRDDAISHLNINRQGIPNSIKKIIQPIVDEIINQQVTIYQKEFLQAMDLFFFYLDMRDKWAVLNIAGENDKGNRNANKPSFTFRPNLSLSQSKMTKCSSSVNLKMNQRQ